MKMLDRETLEAALIGYEHARREIETKIDQLRDHLGDHRTATSNPSPSGKQVRSAAVRKRMAAAQQKRWATKATAESPAAQAKKVSQGKRAPLSPEARERIAAAQRKRWAATKKTAKK